MLPFWYRRQGNAFIWVRKWDQGLHIKDPSWILQWYELHSASLFSFCFIFFSDPYKFNLWKLGKYFIEIKSWTMFASLEHIIKGSFLMSGSICLLLIFILFTRMSSERVRGIDLSALAIWRELVSYKYGWFCGLGGNCTALNYLKHMWGEDKRWNMIQFRQMLLNQLHYEE